MRSTARIALACVLALGGAPAFAQDGAPAWRPAWTGSAAPARFDGTPEAPLGYLNQSIRQDIRLGMAVQAVRLRVSNELGLEPLTIGAMTASSAGEPASPVTFGGLRDVVIPVGVALVSDPVVVAVERFGVLTVSHHVPGPVRGVVRRTAVRLGQGTGPVSAEATLERRQGFVSAVYGLTDDAPSVVVALGDSITEGATSTLGADADWPSVLARRLEAACPGGFVVVNAGISGNQVVRDGRSPNVRARLDRDVLSLPGVTHVILIEGINDIRHDGNPANVGRTAEEVIAAYRQVIDRLHLHEIEVVGGTVTAFAGSERFDERSETARQTINAFIRDGGAFDAVADFDAATRDPDQAVAMRTDFARDDRLHPNDAGYRAMAEAIDLSAFTEGEPRCER